MLPAGVVYYIGVTVSCARKIADFRVFLTINALATNS